VLKVRVRRGITLIILGVLNVKVRMAHAIRKTGIYWVVDDTERRK